MELVRRRSLLAVVAAAAAFAVAGCGDDEETDTAAEEPSGDTATEQTDTGAAAGGESTVEVGMVEFDFEPPDPSIAEDGQVSIELTNDGEFPHAMTIEETEDSSEEVQGGQSTTLEADLDSGEYTIFCPVGDHRAQGMEGTLTVGGGDGGGSDDSGSDDSGSDDSSSDDSGSDDSASAGSGAGY
jgi:plastocyanin